MKPVLIEVGINRHAIHGAGLAFRRTDPLGCWQIFPVRHAHDAAFDVRLKEAGPKGRGSFLGGRTSFHPARKAIVPRVLGDQKAPFRGSKVGVWLSASAVAGKERSNGSRHDLSGRALTFRILGHGKFLHFMAVCLRQPVPPSNLPTNLA